MAEVQGMDGVPRLFAFMPLGRDPQLGFVFAGIPTRVVHGAADQTMRSNLVILGGILLLALGFAWGFGYLFVMRRINPLVQTTARLAAGDLVARTGLTGGPEELGQLAQAFDQMAAALEEREAERQRSEAALRESEERHRTILQTAMDGFWRVDLQGRLLEVNETYCRMSGYSEQELLAMSIPDLEVTETADDIAAHMQKVMAQGEERFETRHRRKDGSIFDGRGQRPIQVHGRREAGGFPARHHRP